MKKQNSTNGNGNGNGFVATIEPTNRNGNSNKKDKKAPDGFKSLAEHLSFVMRDPNTPTIVRDGILYNLNDVFNNLSISGDDPDFQDEDDTSAEYIETLFKRHAEKEAAEDKKEADGLDDLKGMYLHEALHCLDVKNIAEPNMSLLLVMIESKNSPQPILKSCTRLPRQDGRFVLEVVFDDPFYAAPEIKGKNSLKVSDKVYEVLSKDAERCLRTPENQLAAILEAYYSAETKAAPEEKNSGNTETQAVSIVSDDTTAESNIAQGQRIYTQQLENSKKLIDAILMECEYEECTTDALMMVLQIFDDAAKKDSGVNIRDLFDDLKRSLYSETFNFSESIDTYLETLTTGKKYPNSRINHEVFNMFPEKTQTA